MSTQTTDNEDIRYVRNICFAALSVIVALLLVIMGAIAGFKVFGRYQSTADARNSASIALIHARNLTQVTAIQISTQAQQLQVHRQQAQIRQADAVGVREAQDEIARTLTPLYVQFEMTQAIEKIATSGRNSSVIYIPSGAGGVPLVAGAGHSPAVTAP